ncbi:hypothetical protein CEE44_04215 [Candidatus Woesearchaeota archaeon B3_Woes]|nr:MAG: hypothetical protein CEE44_04215 [Candidatus Woesearchaeota archaeon B3_Woes]
MIKKRVVFLLIIFLLISLVIAVNAANNRNVKISSEVQQTLETQKNVKVFIKLKEQNNNLRSIKNEIEDQIGEQNVKHKFKNKISAVISEKDLEKLQNNNQIESIRLIGTRNVALEDSLPLIKATNTHSLQFNSINLTGKGQTICIIDSGVNYSHSDLGGCYGNNTNFSCKIIGGIDYCSDDVTCNPGFEDDNPMDVNGHGTHVSGIVAANGSIKGVAPEAKIIMIKASNSSGTFWDDDLIAAIEWCTDNSSTFNISVISMSLGGGAESSYCNGDSLAPYINAAVAKNISVVVATGNEYNTTHISGPACVQNATPVGSTTKSDTMSSFSNRNNITQLVAPGGTLSNSGACSPGTMDSNRICSTWKDGSYLAISGTSMATPHVAGAVALLQQFYKLQNKPPLTTEQIETTLNNTGTIINDSGGSGLIFRRINTYAAIQSLDETPPSITFVSPTPINYTNTTNGSMEINVSIIDQINNISSCWFEWNYTTNITMNQSSSGTSVTCYLNKSFTEQGVFDYRVYANDSQNNVNVSETRQINVSNAQPNVTINSPIDNYNSSSNTIIFNCTASDALNLTNITLYHNSSGWTANTTNTSGINTNYLFTQNFTEGIYIWNCYACDNYNSCSFATSNRTFTIDTTFPYFNPLPTNQEINYSQQFGYDINATDNNAFTYSVNDTTNFAINQSGYITNNTLLDVITYSLNITINDTAGNENSTIISITVKLNKTSNITANTSTDIDLSQADSNITLFLSNNVTTTITVSKKAPNASGTTSSLSSLKGINITVNSATSGNLTWALIKIYYNSTEITSANIDESTLKIYYYNSTAGDWQLESDQGVDTINNYVWANVTHFSLFGAFGSAPSDPPCSGCGGSGGGGGGSSITTETIVLTRYGITHTELRRNTQLIFTSKDQEYTLTIKKVERDKVEFVFTIDPIKFTLNIEEEKTIDLNSDEKIYIKLENIKNRKADITLRKIVKIQLLPIINLTKPKEETKTEESLITTEEITEQIVEPEKSVKKQIIGMAITTIIVVIGLASFFFFKKSKKNKFRLP